MHWMILTLSVCLGLALSVVLPDFRVALLALAGWYALGYIGWAWVNHNAYADNPKADENSKKWDLLPMMLIYGPVTLLFPLIIGLVDRNLRFGLRFN